MASKHNDDEAFSNQQALHGDANQASNKANNTSSVKKYIVVVGGHATGKRSFAKEYAEVQTCKVQVLRIFSPLDIAYMLRTVEPGTQEVVLVTNLPGTVQRIDSFLRAAYGVVPVVWAFGRKRYVGTLVAGLAGLAVEKIVISEELEFDYKAITAEKIAQMAVDDPCETLFTPSTNNPPESAPTTPNQNEPATSTLGRNEPAPSTLDQNERAPSTLNQNESAPSTLNQNEPAPSTLDTNEPAPSANIPTKRNFEFADKVFFTAFSVLVVNFVLKLVLQRYYFPVLLWGDDIPMIGIYMRAGVDTIIMTIDSMLCKIVWAIYEPFKDLKAVFTQRVEWWSFGGAR